MSNPMTPLRRPITADSALMNPASKVIALKAQIQGTTQDHLQIFNIEMKTKMKSHQMPEQVVYWKWISTSLIGLVTATAVYHWSMEGATEPVKMFDRAANLQGNQIISYRCDPTEKWLVLIGIAPGAAERPQLVRGNMQLFSVEQQRSQALEAHAACFSKFNDATVISFASKVVANGQVVSKLHVIPLGASTFQKKQADLFFPPDFADDFPVAMQISDKYSIIYVVTKLGLLFVYDLETATAIYRNRISPDPIFLTCEAPSLGGFYAINRRGQVLLATVNEQTIVPFVSQSLNNLDLALSLAKRGNLPGAGDLVFKQFDQLFAAGNYKGAAELAAESPQGVLRTPQTIQKFQQVPQQPGQPSPLLQYFGTLLTKGKLNALETVELAKLVLSQNKKALLDNWMNEDKLEASEEFGDLVRQSDPDMALKIYVKAQASLKVVMMFAQRKEYDKIVKYSQQVGYNPDYLQLLMQMMMNDPQGAVNLALMISQQEGGPALDVNTITDLFLQRNMIREATSYLLDVLKPNKPEDAMLQTKVLEINLITFPNVADAILANGMFTHYDRPRIAQLCEKAGLYMRALQHYTEISDIKRVVINTHAIEPQALVEFFGTLSSEWALECMKELLLNVRQNLQLVVQIAKEYTEQLSAEAIIKLLEDAKTPEGLFFYLGSYLTYTEDPDIHFKYIEAAAKTGQIKEVERVTRESNFYNPEQTKQFLMEAKLPDARPLINVCDRHGFIHDLTSYLYNNNMMRFIEGYVQKVNPSNTPQVVGALLDCECNEEFITNLIVSVRSLLPVEPLVEEVEKRNRLKLLSGFLDHLVKEGSQDPHVHNAMGKIMIDSNNNPEHFLTTNAYYDSLVVGKYCEKRDPHLACVAYKRGQCDMELVNVTNKNSMFKLQARYITERMDQELWEKVLVEDNPYRRQLIDQVVSTALPESKNPEQVSVTVKAFMTAELPNELIELLEKIVLQNSAFSRNPNLQNLLILTAIKADKTRVMDYVNRLDSFDGPAVGEIAVGSELYEEAFVIFKKFDNNVQAVKVLIDNIQSIERAVDFAVKCDEPEVYTQVAKAQLEAGLVAEAIASYLKANDHADYLQVIPAAESVGVYDDLIKYLTMVRKKIKEKGVDSSLVYAYARTNKLSELEEFLSVPNSADVSAAGDRCFDEELYEPAKILFSSVSNWGRLASTLVKLHQFQAAVDAARKANSSKTWKEVCFACVEEEEFRLAQLCGLNIIVQADELEEVSDFYQARGKFDELIALMESGLGLDRAHMGIFTELGILYAKFRPEKLLEHLKLFSTRINIPKLLRVCEEQQHWKELAFLYMQYDEYDNAALVMMNHPDAWEHVQYKDVLVKVANLELYYKSISFYLEEHPSSLNDLLSVLSSRVDHARVVDIMRKAGHLPLVRPYLDNVQQTNTSAVNDAINELCVEEEDFEALRASIDTYDNFDQIALALTIEKHELIEFRRIASYIYQKSGRWRQSVELSKEDKLYKDAMETVAQSQDKELAEELLTFFVDQGNKECFTACLFTCYDLIRPDVAMELAWMNGMTEYAMPYMIQFMREYSGKVDKLIEEKNEAKDAKAAEDAQAAAAEQQQNMYAQLLPPALPAPGMGGEQAYAGMGGYPGMQDPSMQMGGYPGMPQDPGMYGAQPQPYM
eukprot:scaffold346_cov387-Prasinococcus_capsulatus_cf.AAC.4